MNNENITIKSERNVANINNVIEIVEKTQYDIFNNMFEYNTAIQISDDVECKIDGKKKSVNLNKELALTLDDETMFRELTLFDRAVHNAVCSLYNSGIESFTTEQVYKIIVGDSKARFNTKIRNHVEESLMTLRNRFVIIKFGEEGKQFHLLTQDGDEIIKVSNYILPLSKTTLRMRNGQKVDAWNLLTEPPLLNYARIKRQIETIAIEQLQVPLALTDNTIKLREFLLRKILLVKRKSLRNGKFRKNYENCNILKYEDIYELFGFSMDERSNKSNVQKKRLLEKCEVMFNYWMKETGMLAKWIYYKNKENEIIGYKLKVNLDKFKLKIEDIWDDEDEMENSSVDSKESEKIENEKDK